jgi:hypothetical protein
MSENNTQQPSGASKQPLFVTLPNKEEYTLQELRTAQVFVGIITAGIFIVALGAIWSIGDIFSQNKFGAFLSLSFFSQLFIVGVIIIGLFILSVFLAVFYRRGRDSIIRALFKEKPKEKDSEAYLPAKIIAAGALISIFIIVIGLLIALIEFMVQGATTDGFWSFLGVLTGGLKVLISGGLVLAFTGLALAGFYAWENGYFFVMNVILRRNAASPKPSFAINKNQKITAQVFFSLLVASVITIFFGIIYAIMDAITPTGKWQNFTNYPVGIQFSIIGCFASALFLLLIGAMLLFQWGNTMVIKALFERKSTEAKDNQSAKIIAVGILAGIFLIAFSLVVWLLSLWFGAFADDITNPFEILASLSGGLIMLSIGLIVLVFVFLILGFAYIFNNGYYLIVEKIIQAQDKIDKSLDTTSIKIQTKIKKPDQPKDE